MRGKALHLRRARARRAGRVQKVDVETDEDRAMRRPLQGFGGYRPHAALVEFLAHDDAQPLLFGPCQGVAAVERAADADLDGVVRQDQPFLEGVVKGRAVIVGLAVIAGQGVAVRVEVHQGHRPQRLPDRPQHAQADGMVAAQHHGHGPGAEKRQQAVADVVQAFGHIAGDGVDVAAVRHAELLADVHVQHRAVGLENGGCLPQGRRAEARAGPVGCAAVEGHAHHHGIGARRVVLPGLAHEGADAAEPWRLQGIYSGHGKIPPLGRRVVRKRCAGAAR